MHKKAKELLLTHCGLQVEGDSFSIESTLLAREELDEQIVKVTKQFPSTILTHLYQYDSLEEDEYLVYFIEGQKNNQMYARGILKNGVLLWSE